MAEVQALKAVEPEGGPAGVMQAPPKASPLKNKR
eukprot:CAMPEP_0184428898 /NCGR_PEP_ID=MMETSP0738-20130409/222161_1 /TAXON_ID=385413 /ORGANISM="Thalassiosira miniscula, Strain CCMP1093" /LENGTH=33 /DNA_ID= /DNA_START= /DNA_END= /DNA_ORIENTATION=